MEQRITRIVGFVFVLAMLMSITPVNTQKAYATSEVPIDEANFPDVNFRNYVSRNFDKNNDSILSKAECATVKKIYVENKNIASLKGIEHFTALTWLNCSENPLKVLDVSENTDLEMLACVGNELTILDVSKNFALKTLNCYSNKLTALDTSTNGALTYLNCSLNQLTTLDISNNPALTYLNCWSNRLTSLDISKNAALSYLSCDSNRLVCLDIGKNNALEKLSCNYNQLTTLDVSHAIALTRLSCNVNQLKSLNVGKNTALTDLSCGFNRLESLDVSKNTALKELVCRNNKLSSLDVSKNASLMSLDCCYNQLELLDLSKNSDLRYLECAKNQLTTLDVSNNTALTSLACSFNQLTSLDISKNDALKYFRCDWNQLKSLDVSKNNALEDLRCERNQLASLDISKNAELHTVDASANPLTSVKLAERDYTYENLNPSYIVSVPKGTSEINFPKGFKIENIVGTIPGILVNGDSLEWDGITKYTSFQYKLCENPEKIVNVSVDIKDNEMPELEEAKRLVKKAEKDKTQEAYLVAKAKVDTLRNGYEKSALDQRLSEVKKVIEEARAKDAEDLNRQQQVPSNSYSSGYITLTPVLEQSEAKGKDKISLEARMTVGSKNLVRTVDGNVTNITMDVAAFIEQDRTYIPLRFVGEALGFDVTWDNASRTAILKNRDKVVKVAVDSNVFYVNGEKFESDVKPQIKNSRTMIPVGNFARAIGLKDGETIFWNDKTREVRIIQEIKL